MDGDVHHGVDARFVEWVVEGSEAGRCGGHTGVVVPDGDGIGVQRNGESDCKSTESDDRSNRLSCWHG